MSNVYIVKKIFFFSILLTTWKLLSSPLVETEWVSRNLCEKDVKIIEVGKSLNSYKVEHINCASFTNFYSDGWRESSKGVSMSLPDPKKLVTLFHFLLT